MLSRVSCLTLLLLSVLSGCGTPRYAPSPRPLQKGESQAGIEFSWELNRFQSLGGLVLNVHGSLRISDQENFEFTIRNFIQPSMGVTHYGYTSDATTYWTASAVLHLLNPYGPHFETALGASTNSGETSHMFSAGLGLTGLLRRPEGSHYGRHWLPILRYSLLQENLRLEIADHLGRTRQVVRIAKEKPILSYGLLEQPLSLPARNVLDVLPAEEGYGNGWTVVLDDGRSLEIRDRDPYPDCYSCALDIRTRNAYTASPRHQTYFVYFWDSDEGYVAELDMETILARFQQTGRLVIAQDPDILERSLAKVRTGWHDLSFAVGYFRFATED